MISLCRLVAIRDLKETKWRLATVQHYHCWLQVFWQMPELGPTFPVYVLQIPSNNEQFREWFGSASDNNSKLSLNGWWPKFPLSQPKGQPAFPVNRQEGQKQSNTTYTTHSEEKYFLGGEIQSILSNFLTSNESLQWCRDNSLSFPIKPLNYRREESF